MAKSSYNADVIQVLEGLEAVRKRPGMYIGSTSSRGLHHLVAEIVDNSVDEHMAGFCSEIYVSMNEDGSVTVSDNGRGVPVDIHAKKKVPAERLVYGVLHAGGKFSDKVYKISGGLHGVGSSVVNALSNEMYVEIKRDGYIYKDSYKKGVPTTKLIDGNLPKEKLPKNRASETGTKVTFYPDETIFETVVFKESVIRQRLKEVAYLNPDLVFLFENKRDKKPVETIHEPGGLVSFVEDMSSDLQGYTPVISIEGEKDGIQAHIVFKMCEDADEAVVGYVNSIKTIDGGTHINAFKQSFARLINQYAKNELHLLKEKDSSISGSDVRIGCQCCVSIKHPDPQFEGQTKQKLGSADAMSAVSSIVMEQLTVFFDRNATILEEIANRAVAASKKKEQDKNKVDLGRRFSFEGNGKLTRQESNEPEKCEIFFVEGDSAGGSARKARNRKYQAVLPMRGKILNVEKAPISKVLENEEIKSIIAALGCGFSQGYNDDFDISKLKYHKIIIMTDADVDGAHIGSLFLTFFYRFYPELINQGHIYLAVPPLYHATCGKASKYLYSDQELEQFKKEHRGKLTVQRYKGLGEMDASQLRETTMDPEKRTLKQIYISDIVDANHLTRLLMGTEVQPRREYIETHALEADIDL